MEEMKPTGIPSTGTTSNKLEANNDEKTSETSQQDDASKKMKPTVMRQPGTAPIKSEYVILKEEERKESKESKDTISKEDGIPSPNQDGEGPKAKRRKGQNKNRPNTVPKESDENKLCPNIVNNDSCEFGENCRYSHDVQKYFQQKPADIGDTCILFEKYGKCMFGVQCRFGSKHICKETVKNIVDIEKHNKSLSVEPLVKNGVKKDTQILLRKNQYSFPSSDSYMRQLSGKREQKGSGPGCGTVTDEDTTKIRECEKTKLNLAGKTYLAPLTTVGNLPFRAICKQYGVDITCGEMAMATSILQGRQSEWALMKRHSSEDLFGVQICGSFPDSMSRCAELLNNESEIDFIDINVGCPIDLVFRKGGGSALMGRQAKFQEIVESMVQVSKVPITVKMRTGIQQKHWNAHKLIPKIRDWGAAMVTLHGRSREGRYTSYADWDYIDSCAKAASPMPLFGNGDILSYEDLHSRLENTNVAGVMIGRGALIKPWIFTEIKEQRHWDISSRERMDMLKDFVNVGLEHWGSDTKGVENCRRFLLEWLSFLNRYIPVGLLEVLPQKINERPPAYRGRDELETLFASRNSADWVKISEMLLGPVPECFTFIPKHKANAYA